MGKKQAVNKSEQQRLGFCLFVFVFGKKMSTYV